MMNTPAAITVTPVLVADLLAEGERMPVYVHVIDHPDGRVLVDTGLTELHPAVADMDPRLRPLNEQEFDLAGIDIVVNTHLHFDHCGGNHPFAGRPIYVQRVELDDARSQDDYTRTVRPREYLNQQPTRPSANGSMRPACGTCPSTVSSSCFPGSGLSRRRGTHAALRWWWSRPGGARSSFAATLQCGSANSTSRRLKASCWYELSTPSWSGSRTNTSHGDPAWSEASPAAL